MNINKNIKPILYNKKLHFFYINIIYYFAIVTTYIFQNRENNIDKGWLKLQYTCESITVLIISLILINYIMMRSKENPSDIYSLFLCNITTISFVFFNSIIGVLPVGAVASGVFLLLFPFFLISLINKIIPELNYKIVHTAKIETDIVIILFLIISVYIILEKYPENVGFGLNNSHIRRIEARSIYLPKAFNSYILSISINGFVPYLAFRAGLKNNLIFFISSIIFAIFFYWLIGVKAQFFYVALSFILGYLISANKFKFINNYFIYGVIVCWIIILIEWSFWGKYSYVADYLFRRIFPVQALDQVYYIKFLFSQKNISWDFINGLQSDNISISFYIGNLFTGNINSNTNTNALISSIASGGIIGYMKTASFISVMLVILDRLWKISKNPSYLFLGFLFGILLIEQAYTVVMVSSGVGLLLLIILAEDFHSAVFRKE
jgi:hypothetical protein